MSLLSEAESVMVKSLTVSDMLAQCSRRDNRPYCVLATMLYDLGCTRVLGVGVKRLDRVGVGGILPRLWSQAIALDVLLYRSRLCSSHASASGRVVETISIERGEVSFLAPGGDIEPDVVVSPKCRGVAVDVDLHNALPRPRPLFVIDLSQLLEHRLIGEFHSLRVQIASSLTTLRLILWDRHLVLTSVREGVVEWLYPVLGYNFVVYSSLSLHDYLDTLDPRGRIIVLDPYADRELTVEDVRDAGVFVLGGIVDKAPRPRATQRIAEQVADVAESRRITLRGSIVGVPNRINAIVSILLHAMYVTSSLEEAIIANMSKRDIRLRAYYEAVKRAGGRGRIVADELCEALYWLPLDDALLRQVLRMAKLEVEGDTSVCVTRRDRLGGVVSKDQSLHRLPPLR